MMKKRYIPFITKLSLVMLAVVALCACTLQQTRFVRATEATPNEIQWNGPVCNVTADIDGQTLRADINAKQQAGIYVTQVVFVNGAQISGHWQDLFAALPELTQVSGNLNLDNADNLRGMFYGCAKLQSVDITLTEKGKSNVDYYAMFENCKSLTTINATNSLDVSDASRLEQMFCYCPRLPYLNITCLNNDSTAKNVSAYAMFYNCPSLRSVSSSSAPFDLSTVTNMGSMFSYCGGLTDLHLSRTVFDVNESPILTDMFHCCISLAQVDLSQFHTSNKATTTRMFWDNRSLQWVDISGITGVLNDEKMFQTYYLSEVNSVRDIILNANFVPSSSSGFYFTTSYWYPLVSGKPQAVCNGPDELAAFMSAHTGIGELWAGVKTTYYGNGGTWGSDTTTTTITPYCNLLTLPQQPSSVPSGMRLAGYDSSATATSPSIVPTNLPIANKAPKTLYLIWTPEEIAVTFRGNGGMFDQGGTSTPSFTITGNYGATFASVFNSYASLVPVYPNNYKFAGYATVPGATTATLLPWDSTTWPQNMSDAASTYYAIYRAPNTVIFSANGGLFAGGALTITTTGDQGDTLALPTSTIERNSYTFAGWGDSPTSTTPVLNPDDPQALPTYATALTTYYAIWTPRNKSVTFDANAGLFGDGTATVQIDEFEGSVITLPTSPTRDQYDFVGWAESPSATEATIIPEDIDTYPLGKNAASTYYAVWQDDGEVGFSANGGVFPSTHHTKISFTGSLTAPIQLPQEWPIKENYTFIGWATTPNATAPEILPTTPSSQLPTYDEAPATYYAVWRQNVATVTFNAAGGTFDGREQVTTTGVFTSPITLPSPDPVWSGKEFLGYASSRSATVPEILPGQLSTYPTYANARSTYYAVWASANTVSFLANGGAWADGSVSQQSSGFPDNTILLPASTPERPGYKFVGWSSNSAASEPNMPLPLPTYETASNIYYAVWKPEVTEVTFNANGGSWDGVEWSSTAGSSYSTLILPPVPVRDGYEFLGWASTPDAKLAEINPQDISAYPLFINAAQTYYAVWSFVSPHWVLDAQGWRYMQADGVYLTNGLYNVDGDFYFFNEQGYIVSGGWQLIDGVWYYFAPSGVRLSGWQWIDGSWYWLDQNTGAMQTGWIYLDSYWYLLAPSGAMLTGWQWQGTNWYFLDRYSGAMQTGWIWDASTWYWCDGSGAMYRDCWAWIGGAWYGFWADGSMCIGWIETYQGWYWCDASGAMCTGWQFINGTWYLFDYSSGLMYAGRWIYDDGSYYYLYASGAMASDTYIDGYYVDDTGRCWL